MPGVMVHLPVEASDDEQKPPRLEQERYYDQLALSDPADRLRDIDAHAVVFLVGRDAIFITLATCVWNHYWQACVLLIVALVHTNR